MLRGQSGDISITEVVSKVIDINIFQISIVICKLKCTYSVRVAFISPSKYLGRPMRDWPPST